MRKCAKTFTIYNVAIFQSVLRIGEAATQLPIVGYAVGYMCGLIFLFCITLNVLWWQVDFQ